MNTTNTTAKKRIMALALALILLLLALTRATLSYFTDTKKATNTFTYGSVSVTQWETNATTDADWTQDGLAYTKFLPIGTTSTNIADIRAASNYNTKRVKVQNDANSNPVYVRVFVRVPKELIESSTTPNYQLVHLDFDGGADWGTQTYYTTTHGQGANEKQYAVCMYTYADKLPANMNLLNRMSFTVQLNEEGPITGIKFDPTAHLYPIKDENGNITGQRAMIPLLSAPKLLEKADPTDENETLPLDKIQVSVQVHDLLATDSGLKLENVSIVINATQNVDEAAAYLGATVVHSAEELQAAVNSGNALIQLGQDIDLGDTPLAVAGDITLDLSGYALTSNSQSVIRVTGGTLTLRNAQNMQCATDGTPLDVVGGTVLTNFDPGTLCDTPATANEEGTEWTITAG